MASSANFLEEALNTDVDQSAVNAIVGSLETQLTTQSSQINSTQSINTTNSSVSNHSNFNGSLLTTFNNSNNNNITNNNSNLNSSSSLTTTTTTSLKFSGLSNGESEAPQERNSGSKKKNYYKKYSQNFSRKKK